LSYFKDSYNVKIVDCSTAGGVRAGGLALLWNNCNFDIEINNHDFNYIDFLINSHNKVWRAIGIYGYSTHHSKFLTCKLINDLSQTSNNQNWLIFGDFNIVLNSDEKVGGNSIDYNITNSFRNTIDMCNLNDLGFTGPKYTWHNRQQDGDYIQARLDRFLATSNWMNCFSHYTNMHLLKYGSHQCPIMLEFSPITLCRQNQGYITGKKFEHMWLRDQDHFQVVKDSWQRYNTNITTSLSRTLNELHNQGKTKFGCISKRIQQTKSDLQTLNSQNNVDPMPAIKEKELDDLLQREELWWSQRSRAMWLKHGDKNTSYFHQKANQRRKKNSIEHISDPQGTIHYDPKGIEDTLINHFKTIFDNQNTLHM
jgi:hypothetical protein